MKKNPFRDRLYILRRSSTTKGHEYNNHITTMMGGLGHAVLISAQNGMAEHFFSNFSWGFSISLARSLSRSPSLRLSRYNTPGVWYPTKSTRRNLYTVSLQVLS
jgi:hypothetical protein